MFADLTKPRTPTTMDNDFRGIFDPSNHPMFKRYESGYCIFLMLDIPVMLQKLATIEEGEITKIQYKKEYGDLINAYIRTIEREFRKLDGLDNLSSEAAEYSGNNEVSVKAITKTIEATQVTITLPYLEPYGAVISRVHELFLRGIDDPIVGHAKYYNGLIQDGILAPSFKNEVFKFLYIVTDNTGLNLERAYYIFNAQPTTSYMGELYNTGRGETEFKEINYEFNCNVLSNKVVQNRAKTILQAITGYVYDPVKGYFSRVSRPLFDTEYSAFDNYRASTDTGYMGPLNQGDYNRIPAIVRQLGATPDTSTSSASSNIKSFSANPWDVPKPYSSNPGASNDNLRYDYNGDGKVNVQDARALLKDIVNDTINKTKGDVNSDGYINAKDAAIILKAATGKLK